MHFVSTARAWVARSRSKPPTSGLRPGLRLLLLVAAGFALCLAPAGGLLAQTADDDGPRWRNTSELSFLMTGGNSVASTLGIRNTLRRTHGPSEFRLDVAGLRTDATRLDRFAVGTSPDDFRVEEDRDRERTAERYGVEGRYDRELSEAFFLFGGVGWARNTFAGFNHRTVASAGAGNRWRSPDVWEVKVGYGLTYTVQRDVTPDPERDDSFAGLRATLEYEHALGSNAEFALKWVVDGNAQEFSDVRGDLAQSVSASLTDRLSMKTTLQLQVDNDPPVESLELRAPTGDPTGERVLTPLGRVDHSLSVALVVTL
jgi:putative salt-induced outer membrane protein YdiY